MIADYRSRGLNVSRILTLLKIPRSTHYYSPPSLQIRRGRKASTITERITDSGIIAITDEQILLDITDLLSREFVCYGYKRRSKIPAEIRIYNQQEEVLPHTEGEQSPQLYIQLPKSSEEGCGIHCFRQERNETWEMDIKYAYIEGTERHTCLPSSTVTPGRSWGSIWDITAHHRM